MRRLWLMWLALVPASEAGAAVQTRAIEYKHGNTVLEGHLAWDDAVTEKRPGVLVIHEWMGCNPYSRQRAEQLARLGYVGFALDMYGKGVLAKDAKEAAERASVFKNDRALMRARAAAGLEILRKQPQVDPARLAAIGYCFGGTTALELARSGADLKAVVSFHGNLATPHPVDAKKITGKVLVLHGADDPIVPPTEVAAFEEEMRAANVDWQLVKYGDAVHSFTNPGAGNDKKRGVAYQQRADTRSWNAMRLLFQEVLTRPPAPKAPGREERHGGGLFR